MSMRVSVTGLNASQTQLTTIANNIANSSTTGFKASRVQFGDIYSADASRVSTGAGVRVSSIDQMMNQGGREFTGNKLDLAINGNGFFQLKDDATDSVTYTRAGNFSLDKDGYVVNSTGSRLQSSEGNDIRITGATASDFVRFDISSGGVVNVTRLDPTTRENVVTSAGTIAIANFVSPQGLAQVGDTTWRATSSSGAALVGAPGAGDRGMIDSGALEGSNVDIAEQLVEMITAQRNFQANAKSITTADAVTQAIINIR